MREVHFLFFYICILPLLFARAREHNSWKSLLHTYLLLFQIYPGLKLAERKFSLGKDWHSACLRCEKCNKTLAPGSHAEHEGKPYCHQPCYSALYGPGGYGRGGAESYVYKK
ncbi:unnamed protein product [Callosobruchus maculatus]|uniref:LIM zinc-binding domain-containing protein n=1 Tax=Callosobruchus maculatus TaxID=64391 RepID=A0A653C8Z3_CALMS|nr:unnamed protein product [Callosobruchus maculatus]